MKIRFFEEPLLKFANDSHQCPRFGITNFETYDSQPLLFNTKPKDIILGVIGTQQVFEKFENWLELCSDFIEEKPSNQANLFTSFCGFNEYAGFKAEMVYSQPYFRQINDTEINKIIKEIKNKGRQKSIEDVAEIYLQHIEFLAQNKTPKVIICLIPDKLFSKVLKVEKTEESDNSSRKIDDTETNFHHLLKAKSMQHKIPIQIVLERTLSTEQIKEKSKSDLQDLATRAWNFCTAVYYKAGGVPWKATIKDEDSLTCFVGISFYRSLDKKTLQTSLAQIFDEQGKGVILRGSPVQIDKKGDRQPHLTEQQSYELLLNAIEAYKFAEGVSPKRVVIHKSSKYTEQESEGFAKAIEEKEISTFDFVNIVESDIRLFRTGNYPPLRGTCLEISENQNLLYSKSAVDYYQTYAGMYIPQPIEIRIEELNSSTRQVCEEILSLTKMNWNNTQFDGKMPITIECSRSVGSIMKYLGENEKPEMRYSFYM
jgi:hypothetical protein